MEKNRTSQYEQVEAYKIMEKLCFISNRCPNKTAMNASVGGPWKFLLHSGGSWGQKPVRTPAIDHITHKYEGQGSMLNLRLHVSVNPRLT